MITRLVFGLLLAGLLISIGRPQVGPLPGMAVLPLSAPVGGACTPSVTDIGANQVSSSSTVSLTGVTVPAGSLIVVAVAEGVSTTNTPSIGSLSDGTNSYSLATSVLMDNLSTKGVLGIFYVANASLSSGTVTYTGQTGNLQSIAALYAANIATVTPLDGSVTATAFGAGTSLSVTSGSASASAELFVAAAGMQNNAFTQDSGNGWAAPPDTAGAFSNIGGGNQVNSGTGAKTFAPTQTASRPWAAAILGFKHC